MRRPKTLRYRELPTSAQQVLAPLPEAEHRNPARAGNPYSHYRRWEASYAPWPQWLHPVWWRL